MNNRALILAAFSILATTAAFADGGVEQPAVNITGATVACTTREDVGRDVFQLSGFQVELKDGADQAADSAEIRLTFDARFYTCAEDATSKIGFSFKQNEDAIHDLGQTWKHSFVLGNYRQDRKNESMMSGFGMGADFKPSNVAQVENGVSYTQEILDIPAKKLLDSKELAVLKAQGHLAKRIVVYSSFDGYGVSSSGGYCLDFAFTMSPDSPDSKDSKIQIDTQTLSVQQVR
jgi:opacity protein-like surface antigen